MSMEKATRRGKIVATIIWLFAFSLINYPVGTWGAQKIYPFIFGMPFSVAYFWLSYSLMIVINCVIAWKIWRD